MRCSQSGPIIRVKEEIKNVPFFKEGCCHWDGDPELDQLWPTRCSDHNKQFMKWKRIKKTKEKFRKLFKRNRHKFIKMITFGLPGEKTTSNKTIDYQVKEPFIRRKYSKLQYIQETHDVIEFEQDHKIWRNEIRSKFNNLRRDPWWKKHVDGGIWFYETVLTEIDEFVEQESDPNDIQMKIHPHFHCMILGPRNLAGQERNFQQLNNLFEKHGLGKPSVSVARSKNGKAINASLNKSLWYLTNYLKKQEHSEGINRGSFGIFNKRSK